VAFLNIVDYHLPGSRIRRQSEGTPIATDALTERTVLRAGDPVFSPHRRKQEATVHRHSVKVVTVAGQSTLVRKTKNLQ